MKKNVVFVTLIFAVITLSSSFSFSAERVYLPFLEMINVHADYQYSSARLLKNYMDEQNRYTLIIPERADSLVRVPSFDKVRAEAKNLNCSYFIIGDMNRVGETVIISVTMYSTVEGTMVWTDRLKASTPDDIDPILQKIARSIGTMEKAAGDGDIYSVTNYQSQQLKQVRATSAFGISLGGAMFFSGAKDDDPFSGGGGVFWTYDAREFLYDIDAKLYFLGDSYLIQGSLNAYHPFFAENNTPFLGGGIGIGHSSYKLETTTDEWGNSNNRFSDGSGIIFYIGGGYMFGRSSNVGMRIHAKYFIGAYKMNNPDKSMPHGLLINFEIFFGK